MCRDGDRPRSAKELCQNSFSPGKGPFPPSVELYRNKKQSFSSILIMSLQSLIARFDGEYLRDQTFSEPFPEDLVELCKNT